MYATRVHGCKSNMTLALYQGNNAEDVRLSFFPCHIVLIPIQEMAGGNIKIFRDSVR
jgi:hypothetical protein